jgi:polysaccharide export outer membrane protein
MTKFNILAAAVACGLLSTGEAPAQTDRRDPGIATNMVTPASDFRKTDYLVGFWRLSAVSKDYQMGAGDRLQVEVFAAPELSQILQSTTITSAGTIALPMIGDVKAAGLTAEELESEIGERLKRNALIERPEVLVTVTEYESKPVYVIGEVDNPGQYVMSQPWTMTEAILIAGGIDWTAGRFGYLHRRLSRETAPAAPPPATLANPEKPGPGYEVIRVDLQPLKDGGVLQPDPVMQTGDVVVVPAAQNEMAFVIGDVYSRGGIVLPSSGRLSVSRALSAAGPTRTSKLSAGMVVRYEPNGTRKELPIDFLAILEGRQPDFEIKANDVIFVPGSNAKTLGYGLLMSIPTIVQNAIVIAIF